MKSVHGLYLFIVILIHTSNEDVKNREVYNIVILFFGIYFVLFDAFKDLQFWPGNTFDQI